MGRNRILGIPYDNVTSQDALKQIELLFNDGKSHIVTFLSLSTIMIARKSKFLNIFKWSLIGCAIGAGAVVWFGPMLIVFGMFLVGMVSVALREIISLRRYKRNVSCDS